MSRWDDMPPHAYADDDDSDEEGTVAGGHKVKPRRKSNQRPQGSDQIRQAFSKRKKGLVLKAYQLNSLTDAKVFMFIVNDKGTSWAYATPGFANSLNTQLLKQLRCLADVPEQAKLFTEVIPCPNGKNSSHGSSEQTGTQRTDPSAEYVPPSTRTATGSLPSRSRSSYSWGSDGQAPGPQGPDKLTRTSSTAANARATQPTPQSDEHSPTLPKARPPSGSSMACGTRTSLAGTGSYFQYHQHAQLAGRAPGMEPPTPCGVYNLLGQPMSAQDSPSEVAMSCGGSPSSRLMPPPDAAVTGRLLAANAQAAAAAAAAMAADGHRAAATARAPLHGFQMPVLKTEPGTGDWAPQGQQLQEAAADWDFNMYQQQQQYMQQQLVMQQQQAYAQQQQFMQQHHQQPQQDANFFAALGPGGTGGNRPAPVDMNMTAAAAEQSAAAAAAGMSWGAFPQGVGSNLLNCSMGLSTQQLQHMQQQHLQMPPPPQQQQQHVQMPPPPQQQQQVQMSQQQMMPQQQQQQEPQPAQEQEPNDAFEAMKRGLAPLRLAKPCGSRPGTEGSGPHSAPAAGGAVGSMLGPPSQWVNFPDTGNTAAAAGSGAGMAALRTASDAGLYGQAGSYAPSPSSCTNQTSGNGSTPAAGAGVPNAAQALLMARAGGSVSQSPSPTAVLSQRMTILAMHSPTNSPLHPSAVADQQQQQQQGSWGQVAGASANGRGEQQCVKGVAAMLGPAPSGSCPGSCPPSQDQAYQLMLQQQQQQQQHNQGAFIPQTDDLLSDPIVEMLMDQPLGQLAVDGRVSGPGAQHHRRYISIMEATMQIDTQAQAQMHLQQQQQMPQQDTACVVAGSTGAGGSGGAGGSVAAAMDVQQSDNTASNLFAHIPPPPKSDADKAAWQAQVRRILGSLQPQQRQELMKLSEQQWLLAQAGSSAAGGAGAAGSSSSSATMEDLQFTLLSSGPPPPAPASAAAASGPASGNYGRTFGGKQRAGPSRLSASSPAIDLGSAAADASAAAAATASCASHQQLPVGYTYFVGANPSMQGQQPATCQDAAGAAGGLSMPMAAGFCSMPLPVISSCAMLQGAPVSSNPLGYICTADGVVSSLPLPADGLQQPVSCPVGLSGGFSQSYSGSMSAPAGLCAGGQMLPLPTHQQVLGAVSEPALGTGASPFATSAQVMSAPGNSCYMQVAAAGSKPGTLLSELLADDRSHCSSPLKRSQPSSAVFGTAAEEGMSPMKRVCTSSGMEQQQQQQGLPEPPSFATLLQAEASGEDDAIAWATAAAASDSMKRVGGSCVSLGVSNALGSLDSFPSAFLRLGSIPGVDSMQLLNMAGDLGVSGQGSGGALVVEQQSLEAAGAAAEAAAGVKVQQQEVQGVQ